MKKHIIDLNEMLDFRNAKGNDEIVYASQLPIKKLTFTIYGGYRVYSNGLLIKECIQPFDAVESYNNI